MAITGHIHSRNWNGMECVIYFVNNFQMRQTHRHILWLCVGAHREFCAFCHLSARKATASQMSSRSCRQSLRVMRPKKKAGSGNIWGKTYRGERERKEGGRALKTTGKKHGPKEARPLSFWLVEKHWECDFLNPSLTERETGERQTGNPDAATKRTCSLEEEMSARKRERESWSGCKDNDLITVCHHERRAWPLHTLKPKTVFTPT